MLLFAVALDVTQTSLHFASSVIYLLQVSLPGAAVHSLDDTQTSYFGDLGELLIVEVDHAIAIDVEHQSISCTDVKKLPSAELMQSRQQV